MLQVYTCSLCGAKIEADPDVETVHDLAAFKASGGRADQRHILCNPPCHQVLYRDVFIGEYETVDGVKRKVYRQIWPVPAEPTVDVSTDSEGRPTFKKVSPAPAPAA